MKWEDAWKLCSVVALGMALSGCSMFAKLDLRDPIGDSAAVSSTSGYLYGKFQLDRDFLNLTRLLLRVEDEGGRTFEILFATGTGVQAIAVEPGTYRIKEFLFTPGGPASMLLESEVSKIPLPAEASFLAQPVRVEAGKAYYIGDFLGTTRRSIVGVPLLFMSAQFKGSVVGISESFDSTTQAFKQEYPGLRSLEVFPAYKEPASVPGSR